MAADLKVIDHPDKNRDTKTQVVDFGWAKVTIDMQVDLTLGNSVYILELAKLELMGVPYGR